MDRLELFARGLKREGLIATWVAVVVLAWTTIGLISAMDPHSNVDWPTIRSWAFFVIGLFAYGHVARKLAQLAEAVSQPK